MTRLAIITTLWGRPALSNLCLLHYRKMRVPGVKITVYAAASPGEDPHYDSGEIPAGVVRVHAPNEPLGSKWNAVAARAAEDNPHGIMVVGSDDFASAAYVRLMVRLMEYGHDFLSSSHCVMHDLATGQASLLKGARIGAGRIFSARVIEKAGGKLWPSEAVWNSAGRAATDKRPKVDGSQETLIKGLGFKEVCLPVSAHAIPGEVPTIIDIKTGDNRWAYKSFDPRENPLCEPVPNPTALIKATAPDVADRILMLAGK